MESNVLKPAFFGVFAAVILLGLYFAILSLLSGWDFAAAQFFNYWNFVAALSAGFGIQVGLYAYLKSLIKKGRGSGGVIGVTGTTSTAAMISCCTHYLANLLPILGAVGVVTFVAQYQIELFWIGIIFNLAGIVFIIKRIYQFRKV